MILRSRYERAGLHLAVIALLALFVGGCTSARIGRETQEAEGSEEQAATIEEEPTGPWKMFAFEPGQDLMYTVKVEEARRAHTWSFRLFVGKTDDGRLWFRFIGHLERQFSDTIFASPDDVARGLRTGLLANWACWPLFPLFTAPWAEWFADRELAVGAKWSVETGGQTISFSVTGTETYAGITGYVCEWTIPGPEGEESFKACIHPGFPLVLYARIPKAGRYYEYTLVDHGGF